MAYIGTGLGFGGFVATIKDSFTGDGSETNFTLSRNATSAFDLEVFVGNVRQEPAVAYTVSGTTLSFTGTPANGEAIYVVHQSGALTSQLPSTFLGVRDYTIGGNLNLNVDNSSALKFGADQDVTVTHVADSGLTLKNTATADDKPFLLTLQTGETDIAASDKLGIINFQAPDEGTGTDAILVAAGIEAVSEGDFSSSSNATKLSFKTASSETATEKMSLSSAGVLDVDGGITVDNITIDGTEIDLSSGDLTIDVAGDINLDADGGDINFLDGGTAIGGLINSSSDFLIASLVQDKDIILRGNDAGSTVAALTLDMSEAGAATFNGAITGGGLLTTGGNIVIPNNANIGSAGDTDSISIDSSGNITASQNLTVAGTLTVNGTTTTVNSTTVTVDDPIFTLGGDSAPGSDDNKDRGIEFRYHDGSSAKVGFFGFDDSTSAFTFIPDATNSSEVFSGTAGNFVVGTLEATTDTSAGDSAAIGFTSAEGLILTGQGSTSDITFKNDADTTVFSIPTGTDDILFPDNAAILMGDGSDLKIFHNGSHSQINDLSTGNLQLLSNGAGVDILKTDGEVMGKFITDGAVELYHDNSKKLETTSSGITVTGVVVADTLDVSGTVDFDGTTNLDVVDIDGAVDMAAGLTVTGGTTITTADNTAQLTLKSTDADATAGPVLLLNRDSGSPADGDNIGRIQFKADDDTGSSHTFARIDARILDASNGSETGGIEIMTEKGGATHSRIEILAGETVINEDSQDLDFRVESDGNANMLVVNAGNNCVGVGGDPNVMFHVQGADAEVCIDDSNDFPDLRFRHGGTTRAQIIVDNNNTMEFHTGPDGSVAQVGSFESDGDFLVGKTSDSFGTVGTALKSTGEVNMTRDSAVPVSIRRNSDEGDLIELYKDTTSSGKIGIKSLRMFIGSSATGLAFEGNQADSIYPASPSASGLVRDNFIDLGYASGRFDDVFATNGTIQTSDENEKQNIASLTSAEMTAAKAIGALFKTYKWKDKVTAKGDAARTHTGVVAQEVQAAMSAAGLDATKYAFWCSNTWWETSTEVAAVEGVDAVYEDVVIPAVEAKRDGNGSVYAQATEERTERRLVKEGVEAQDAYTRVEQYHTESEAPDGAIKRTRLGVRYPELLAFIGAATEQRLADIETRLTALEAD